MVGAVKFLMGRKVNKKKAKEEELTNNIKTCEN